MVYIFSTVGIDKRKRERGRSFYMDVDVWMGKRVSHGHHVSSVVLVTPLSCFRPDFLDYDGGDCCECTCDASGVDDDGACGQSAGFACIDPAAACVDDDSVTVDMIDNCYAGEIGDGYCDAFNNRADCGMICQLLDFKSHVLTTLTRVLMMMATFYST